MITLYRPTRHLRSTYLVCLPNQPYYHPTNRKEMAVQNRKASDLSQTFFQNHNIQPHGHMIPFGSQDQALEVAPPCLYTTNLSHVACSRAPTGSSPHLLNRKSDPAEDLVGAMTVKGASSKIAQEGKSTTKAISNALHGATDLGCSQISQNTYRAAVTVEVHAMDSLTLQVMHNTSEIISCMWMLRQSSMNCSVMHSTENSSVISLDIIRITEKHAGMYELSMKTKDIGYNVRIAVKVKGKPRKPYFTISGRFVSCISESYPKPSVDWFLCLPPYSRCKNKTGNIIYKELGNYGIEQVEHKIPAKCLLDEHIGCCASNDFGRECSQLYTIDLTSEESEPGIFLKVGESFVIRCRARYRTYDFSINWHLENNNMINSFEESDYDTPSTMVRVLFASNAWMEKSNNYTCESSAHPSKSTAVTLLDKGFIEMNTSREVYEIDRNKEFCFVVVFKAYPAVRCLWYYQSKPFPCEINNTASGYSQSKYCSHKHAQGEYIFYVENDDVQRNKTFTLDILPQNTYIFPIATGVCGFCILFLIVLVLSKYKKQYKYESQLQMIQYVGPSDNEYIYINFSAVEYDLKWEFPRENLEFGKILGSGAFGKVINATAYGITKPGVSLQVAVKMLKENPDVSEKDALMSELKMMTQVGHHENIVNLLGACTLSGPIYLIFEYCCHGDLLNYLRSKRETFHRTWTDVVKDNNFSFYHNFNHDQQFRSGHSVSNGSYNEISRTQEHGKTGQTQECDLSFEYNEPLHHNEEIKYVNSRKYDEEDLNVLTFEDLLCFSYQVAKGMEFLESKLCIHRDLAARNILLTHGKVAKICDFGLARDVVNDSNYVVKGNARLPVKWMAPESIFDGIYTIKSDVWSYGILLWEIFSLGVNPYPGMQVNAKFYKLLQSGFKMDQPYYASDEIYFLMQSCWAFDSRNRPSFPQLVSFLGYQLSNTEALVCQNMDNNNFKQGPYHTNSPNETSHLDAEEDLDERLPMC
ncbi:receptor-type tyrosine-protein kinase FLT3 [Discoglossus pictus]